MKKEEYLPSGELAGLIGSLVITLKTESESNQLPRLKKLDQIWKKRLSGGHRTGIKIERLGREKMEKEEQLLAIGELAHMVGITVRTLQYYDEQDLLKPIVTEGGRRKYTRGDILRLEQILFLKSLGFSLEEINEKILDLKTSEDFRSVFTQQRKALTGQINHLKNIVRMLDTAISETNNNQEINMDRMIAIMESIKRGNPYTFVVRYFNDEQLKSLAIQFFGTPDRVEDAKEIFRRLEMLYQNGADPAGKEGQELAKQWWDMVRAFTAGDRNLLKPLIYAGRDIQNWPEEAKTVKEPIENFLTKALNIYLHHNGIPMEGMERQTEPFCE